MLFYFLNSFEKQILIMYYQEKIDDRTISKLLNKHINTINIKRREIVKKIELIYKKQYIRKRRSKIKNVV